MIKLQVMEESSTVAVKGGSRVDDSVEKQNGELQVSHDRTGDMEASSSKTTFSTDESRPKGSAGETTPRSAFKKNDEYTTQFFGFTTKSFCNGIYNAYNCLLLDVLETWSEFVHQQFSSKCGLTEEKMNAACENIRKALVSKMDIGFDRLELYMENNMFHVPKSIVLEEDKAHSLWDPSADDEAEVDEEIEELTQKIMAQKFANAMLREELKVVDSAQQRSDAILQEFTDLWKAMKQSKVSDLREAFVFTLNRIQQCLEITEEIRHLSQNPEDFPKENTMPRYLDMEIAMLGQESVEKGKLS